MMQSKLSRSAYYYSILILIFPFAMIFLINKFYQMMGDYQHWGIQAFVIFAVLITIFVVIWGFFVEMNMRMAQLRITEHHIIIKQLLGYGSKRTLDIKDIDGFVTKGFKTRGQYQEFCYLIRNNKAIAVFSSVYYSNYNEIRSELQRRLKYLGD